MWKIPVSSSDICALWFSCMVWSPCSLVLTVSYNCSLHKFLGPETTYCHFELTWLCYELKSKNLIVFSFSDLQLHTGCRKEALNPGSVASFPHSSFNPA